MANFEKRKDAWLKANEGRPNTQKLIRFAYDHPKLLINKKGDPRFDMVEALVYGRVFRDRGTRIVRP